jgi:hypothetical protein
MGASPREARSRASLTISHERILGVETTHWNLTTMQTVFSVAMEKLNPESRDKALALLPFSRELWFENVKSIAL